ncbi:CA13 (predicted) [Pycnogonum litorale]
MMCVTLNFIFLLLNSGFVNSQLPKWSYKGTLGVNHWVKDYPDCEGLRQSPIDINSVDAFLVQKPLDLRLHYYDELHVQFIALNDGHFVIVSPTEEIDDVGLNIGENKYKLKQLHFHWGSNDSIGSEHIIDGKVFPLELHIVHTNVNYENPSKQGDGYAVLGIMYKIGEKNENFEPMIDSMKKIKYPNSSEPVEKFKLMTLLPSRLDYFRYFGGLTQPPCSESVVWSIFKQPVEISAKQMNAFRHLQDNSGQLMVDNFRKPFSLNNRIVELRYDQNSSVAAAKYFEIYEMMIITIFFTSSFYLNF